MNWQKFKIEEYLRTKTDETLNESQKSSLKAVSVQLREHGAIIADEVGTGKTRIACALIDALLKDYKRSAVIIPVGLLPQWQREFSYFSKVKPIVIKNYADLLCAHDAILTTNAPLFISQTFEYPLVRQNTWWYRYLFLSTVLYLKKENHNFGDYRNFGKSKAEQLLRYVEKAEKNVEIEENLIKWAHHFAKENLLFKGLTLDSIAKKYPFNFGEESSYHRGAPGHELMVKDVLPKMFGQISLVVIDEAHKSKGDGSRLNTILSMVSDQTAAQRVLAMTATPIELHQDQWIQLLKRIRVDDVTCNHLSKIISNYSHAFHDLAALHSITPEAMSSFQEDAKNFENFLGKYITRRKKSICPHYLAKGNIKVTKVHPHRDYKEELIRFKELDETSKKWVFLHECLSKSAKSLSYIKDKNKEASNLYEGIKRLDSYFSRGHVLKTFNVEEIFSEENKKNVNDPYKFERAKFFAQKWIEADQPLYIHPRIRKAIKLVEHYTESKDKEKVLVFGNFSGPIKTLELCLNARFILKTLSHRKIVRIPKDFFKNNEELCAYEAKQLGVKIPTIDEVEENERRYENKRKHINDIVEKVLSISIVVSKLTPEQLKSFTKRKKLITARTTDEVIFEEDESRLEIVIKELIDEMAVEEKFTREQEDSDSDDDAQSTSTFNFLDENALSGSEYAMLLNGQVDLARRSVIQTEFNRKLGFPRVLIAQSQVGKEGLNLHKACKVVLLFNADWNPGVVEQQIGRVDRLKCLWEKKKDEWISQSDESERPVIEVIELHFEGTYDQSQWSRLKERKQTLLYQLYNSLDSNKVWSDEDEEKVLKAMPDFSPEKYLKRNAG